ncbi:Protein of unknown function [Pyronema omphalodes CBS 100304]|uniref:Uncharacterized protein n=1 Tax=Pyronema omphalodes (strain CBS 100304) TaxID=1076935 RepID=U4LR23_PYROM|nr:Protein of unknown function [Pyronema omphalodes CBS 100304]
MIIIITNERMAQQTIFRDAAKRRNRKGFIRHGGFLFIAIELSFVGHVLEVPFVGACVHSAIRSGVGFIPQMSISRSPAPPVAIFAPNGVLATTGRRFATHCVTT